jgi:phage-related protein
MNSEFTEITRPLTQENWIVTGMSYDAETIEVVLSSAIDAVGVTTPRRVLTQAMVGELPISAAISSR